MVTLNEKQLETLLGLLREENSRTGKTNLVEVNNTLVGQELYFEYVDPITHVGRLRGRLDEKGDFPA